MKNSVTSKTMKNVRRWTENELELFAEVLADPEKNFAISLKKLVLKKSANNEVLEHTKNIFERKWITKFSNRIMLIK